MTELTQTEVREFFRPSFWPNTPDILTEALQYGGRPAFMARFVLAATLCASYGIYGPAFELMDARALREGSEEYLDSEKYQLRDWDLEAARQPEGPHRPGEPDPAREPGPAAERGGCSFHAIDNEQLVAYSKTSDDGANVVVVVVNLDPHHVQSGWVELPLARLGHRARTGPTRCTSC